MVFIESVLPNRTELPQPQWYRVPRFLDRGKTSPIHIQARPQNHSSRDRGLQLATGPDSRRREKRRK